MSDLTSTSNSFSPSQIAGLLQATSTILRAEAGALEPAQLQWRPAPDVWCINEVIGHLIEAEERGFAGRIRTILASEMPEFATWDQPAVARARNDCTRDGRALLREFAALRASSITRVESLQPGQLNRSGHHPVVGVLTVNDLLHEWVFHDRMHLQQVLDIVKALVWPHMGNSRRFSAPED